MHIFQFSIACHRNLCCWSFGGLLSHWARLQYEKNSLAFLKHNQYSAFGYSVIFFLLGQEMEEILLYPRCILRLLYKSVMKHAITKFCFWTFKSVDSWWLLGLVITNFLASFFRSTLPLLLPWVESECLVQGHQAGFMANTGLELIVPWFLARSLNHYTKQIFCYHVTGI